MQPKAPLVIRGARNPYEKVTRSFLADFDPFVMFFTASAAQAAKRVPGPLEGPKGVATATVQFVPIVSTNIGPVVTAQMPSATPKP